MTSNEELINNFELKIKQLIAEQNVNHNSDDNSIIALKSYCENQERIDRLNFAITQLKKRGAR